MCTPAGYIELNRRFCALHGASVEETAGSSYLRGSFADSTLEWDALLKERLVIVLGEPGSGKSWEFRRRCRVLKDTGKPAFLIELERLVLGDWAAGFSPADLVPFQQWQQGRETGFFFLDSVDEAKIRRQADLYAALDKVVAGIGPLAIGRAHIFISSRISEWQPETDLHEVLARFGIVSHAGSSPSEDTPPLVVQIEPLDRERVRTFAERRGIGNADRFVEELDNRSAWEFARRPLDVLDLAEFWSANGRLGTLTEIIEHDVTTKLRETTQRHTTFPLSAERARDGAEALAVATILCKRHQFKVPDDTYKAPEALDAARCLPADWVPAHVAALLSRPLFDSATYGQIRFHHRRVAEYLAACWFRRRMSEGCPAHVLCQRLFEEVRGAPVPRRSLIPVIAWLCDGNAHWNDEVRARVVGGAPDIHLEYGDPEKLPLAYKRRLLEAWIDRNKDREDVWTRYSPEALRRLAEPQLAPDVARHLGDGATAGKVRELLVHLVRHGRLVQCVPNLVALLGRPAESDDVKLYAMAALRDIGTPESRRQAWEILRAMPALPRLMCSVACEALYPDTIGAAELATLLEKPRSEKENVGSLQHTLERHLEERLTPEQAGALIGELNRLAQLPPHIRMSDAETRISVRFAFLLDLLPQVLTKLLPGATLTDAQCAQAAESLSLLAESRPFHRPHADSFDSLDELTHAHPRVRRCFFWQTLERLRDANGAPPSPYLLMHDFHSIVEPAEPDLQWMIEDIGTSQHPGDRKLLLTIVLRHAPRRLRARLERAVGSDAELTAMLREDRSARRWGRLRSLRYRWTSAAEWKHWWFMRRHAIRRRWESFRERCRLRLIRGRLRSGRAIGDLAALCHEAASDGSTIAPASWKGLADRRGTGLADAVKAGCKRVWRDFSPQLPHERSPPSSYGPRLVVGLAGIQSAVMDGELAFGSISDDDARLLTRYAVNEMNGFPPWLHELATAKPGPVADVLRACVLGEWQYPADRERVHDLLADLAWEGQALARLARPAVMDCFRAGDPVHPAIREAAVTLVVKTTTLPDEELAGLAADRCRALPFDSAAFFWWMGVCLQVNADQAITTFEQRLVACPTADDVVLGVCTILAGDVRRHLSFIANPEYLRPRALTRLIPLVYAHIRPAEDSDHSDGAPYTATPRDEASRFRDGLLTRLAQSDDPAALESLRELSVHPQLSGARDWILHLIDERLVHDADYEPWDPAAIQAFARDPAGPTPRPDVVVVTVNAHETRAVFDAFQAATGSEALAVPLEDRVYRDLGTLNGTRVFHALSEMGSGGIGAMQQTVDKAIRALAPGAVIAVGIAFGVDENKQEIGDILLSKQLRPYELQRVGKDEIVLRSPRPDASPRLVNYFVGFAQTKWKGTPVKPGVMLTGEKLVDNVDYRAQLQGFERDAIGGEMEGAGLYASGHDHKVDWIVLKAICDFADGNKGKDKEARQQLAAQNAAQFLIEALRDVPLKRSH
ncbi:MAG: hypothetical protein JWO38_4514 [Gemmataceae bacterium]|nr:hypothetical protein [Gemmataceae bacterium]